MKINVYVNRENYSIISAMQYDLLLEQMIETLTEDRDAFSEWLDCRYSTVEVFFMPDAVKNTVWNDWVEEKTLEVEDILESEWVIRSLDV